MKLRVLYHGHCFDGVASAATFTRFYEERINPNAEVNYTGLLHRPGNLFDLDMFDSDENAIVDFKYAASERLTWWFDHHESAFLTPEDEAHFRADTSGRKFLDPTRKSCTEFIADVAHERFGFDVAPIESLVHWARNDRLLRSVVWKLEKRSTGCFETLREVQRPGLSGDRRQRVRPTR